MARSGRSAMVAVLAATTMVVATACAGGDGVKDDASPPPPAPEQPTSTTTATTLAELPDLSQVPLAPVPGRVRVAVDVRLGGASLSGVVVGPEGPAPGAVVRAERLVGEAEAGVEAVTGPGGRWFMGGVKGGRYRVRAWRPPDLTLLEPAVFFLAATEARDVSLTLERRGPTAAAAIAPNPPLVNQPANLAVRVVQHLVDQRGILRSVPLSGVQVEIGGGGGWVVTSANPAFTDATGVARWEVTCLGPGAQPTSVHITGTPTVLGLNVPACR